MKLKYLLLTFISFLSATNIDAQNYIKFINSTEIDGNKFIKGEIYQQISDEKILFGKDTLDIGKAKIEKIKIDDISQIDNKLDFATNVDNVNYQINVTKFLNGKDTVILIMNNNKEIPFFSNGNITVSINECGSPFRIIIPNLPTMVFFSEDIPAPQSTGSIIEGTAEVLDKEDFFSKMTWWKYVIGGVLLLLVLYLIYKYVLPLFKKKKPNYDIYYGGKLSDFAKNNNIEIAVLEKYNKSELKGYSKMDEANKQKLLKNIKNKNLIIGYETIKTPFDNNGKIPSQTKVDDNAEQIPDLTETISKLKTIEQYLQLKNQLFSSNEEAKKTIEGKDKEIERMTEEKKELDKEIIAKDEKIKTLNNDLNLTKVAKEEFAKKNTIYEEKVIFVDFLVPYAKLISDYYDFCQSIYAKVFNHLKKLDDNDLELYSVMSQLLLKYNSNLPSGIIHWVGVVKEIKDSGATANGDLKRALKDYENENDKIEKFREILLKEVLKKYSSNVLILIEEFSNLSKFTNVNNPSKVREIEQFFEKHKIDLIERAKIIGLTFNYVPLFELSTQDDIQGKWKAINQTCSLPYKNVKNVPNDSILEIINYGFGTEHTTIIKE